MINDHGDSAGQAIPSIYRSTSVGADAYIPLLR